MTTNNNNNHDNNTTNNNNNNMNNNPQAGAGRPLPKKESDLFKNVVKHYEGKQYKKAIKQADAILKKFPNHGETLAMKGLTLNHTMSKKEDAHALVKEGLMNDMRSHVCWHVYGLLYRSDHDYNEAIKAYKQALRIDPENLQILRDLSMLQIQMRDLDGFAITRNTLLTLKPNAKINWMAFALARHLIGDLYGAVKVIDIYLGTLTEGSAELGRCYESSELALYRNSILAEVTTTTTTTTSENTNNTNNSNTNNNYKEALDHLGVCEGIVVDRGAWLLKRMEYQLRLKDYISARQSAMLLFQRGMTEDHHVHSLYMCAILELGGNNHHDNNDNDDNNDNNDNSHSNDNNNNNNENGSSATTTTTTTTTSSNCSISTYCDHALQLTGTRTIATTMKLSPKQKKLIYDTYTTELIHVFPESHAIQRIPITLLEGNELRRALDKRCRQDLIKGVPSLCSELHSFLWTEQADGYYTRTEDPADIRLHPTYKMFIEMSNGYISNLSTISKFSPNDDNEVKDKSTTLLWAWYLRAGLHELAGEYVAGIALLDQCIQQTNNNNNPPTAADVVVVVDVYELKARLLEACGNIQAAVTCIDIGRDLDRQDRYINNQTTKYMLRAGMEDDALKRISLFTRHEGNPEQNLYDMQCSWYELELAKCLAKKHDYGRSLKKYAAVVKHFDDFHEDQFDFHSYCLRKVTLRAYVSVLRFEDEVYGQEFYCTAAAGIIRIYLYLFDHPKSNDIEEPDYSNMTPAERKKAKNIARKKKKAAEKKEAEMKEKDFAAAASSTAASTSSAATTTGGENGNNNSNNNSGGGNNKSKNQKGGKPTIIDEDPLGKEFLKKNPMNEAKKYSSMLTRYAPKQLDTWILQYDVAIRRRKTLMALQALHKARSIIMMKANDDCSSSQVFTRIVDFAQKLDTFIDLPVPAQTILKEGMDNLLSNKSIAEYVKDEADRLRSNNDLTDLPMRTAVAKALLSTKMGTVDDAISIIIQGGLDTCRKVTVETCQEAFDTIRSFGSSSSSSSNEAAVASSSSVSSWIASLKERFPFAFSSVG